MAEALPTARTNGNGRSPDPQAAAQRVLLAPQESYAGTPRFQGTITQPDDYVAKLQDPIARMDAFEEMRRSDEAVNTAITSRVSLGRSSNWLLSSPSDSPKAIEILEFVEDNLYGPPLEHFLGKMYGAVHYGVAVMEPVFDWSDGPPARAINRGKIVRPTKSGTGRRIYLQKFAHIRQRTIYTFHVSPQGELQTVEQWVHTGTGYVRPKIDARKLCIWTYDKDGDDFWGIPPTRYAYRAYTLKQQIEKLNLLGLDRFGAGTPVAEAGEGWTPADYTTLEKYMASWRVGTNTYLIHPPGGKVSIVSGNGTLIMSALSWVQFYTVGITMQWLSQGGQLSFNSTSGARALGETMYTEAGNAVQSDNDQLAAIINEQVIIPLVDANFGPQEEYPIFNPSQRVREVSTIGEVLTTLVASKFIHPTPQDEAYIREALKLPTIAIADLEAAEEERKAMAPVPGEEPAGGETQDKTGDEAPQGPRRVPDSGKGTQNGRPESGRAAPARVAASQGVNNPREKVDIPRIALARVTEPPVAATREAPHRTREWTEFEASVMKPDVLIRDLDLAEAQLTAEVQQVLGRIDLFLAHTVEQLAAEGAGYLGTRLEQLAVPAGLKAELREVLARAAARIREYGRVSIGKEASRQRTPDAAGPKSRNGYDPGYGVMARRRTVHVVKLGFWDRLKQSIAGLLSGDEGEDVADADDMARDLALVAEIDAVVAAEIARREQSARSAVADALAQAPLATPDELRDLAGARARGALEELSTARTRDTVGAVVSSGFGTGRRDGIDTLREAFPDGIRALVYSAVMDLGTCEECAKWDGAQFPPDYDQSPSGNVKAPNPNCAGSRTRCRCTWVVVLEDEAPSIVGPSKGPMAASAPREDVKEELHFHVEQHPSLAAPPPPANVTIHNTQPAAPNIALHMPPIALTIHVPGREPVTRTVTLDRDATGAITGTVKET